MIPLFSCTKRAINDARTKESNIFGNISDFTADKFTPTILERAKKKAQFAKQFIRFVGSDFARRQFTERFYRRLASTFRHVARRQDFFDEFFTSAEGKSRFLRETVQYSCPGDPTFTFSDVGRALQFWLIQNNVLAKYDQGQAISAVEQAPTVVVLPQADQTLLNEIKAAYRTQNLRPVRGFFFVPGKRVDVACPFVALALHKNDVARDDPDLARNDESNFALEWAAQTFGNEWSSGMMDGFDCQEPSSVNPDYTKGYGLGRTLAQEILPGERIC